VRQSANRSPAAAAFAELYADAEQWLFGQALPFWANYGVDRKGWGFWEQFSLDGQRIVGVPRRTRVVARQIFCFLAAGRMGWSGDWLAVVDHGAQALFETCLLPDGLVVSTCDDQGRPLDADFDFYDHSFALFTLGELAQMEHHRARAISASLAMLDAMEARFAHPVTGFAEDDRGKVPLRANPHMHFLEACLTQSSVPGASPRWRDWSNRVVAMALTHFIQPKTGALHEFFDWQWEPMPDASGRLVEPGHQFEWSWLLRWWNSACGDERVERAAARLFAIGIENGISKNGLAIDELSNDLSVRVATARNWPQTEWLKASLAAAQLSHSADEEDVMLGQAAAALTSLMSFFATPVQGLWYDRLADDGTAIGQTAPASSFYHIICALEQSQRFLRDREV
jgi:mannose-6-phosphate isomerase